MKYFPPWPSSRFHKLNLMLFLIFVATHASAQVPEGIPNDNSKVVIDTPFDVIVYILLPGLMVGYFFWWRRKYKK